MDEKQAAYKQYLINVILENTDATDKVALKIELTCSPLSEVEQVLMDLRHRGVFTDTIMGFHA